MSRVYSLDADTFSKFIVARRRFYEGNGFTVHAVALSTELEPSIYALFTSGKLPIMTNAESKKGKVDTYLDGVKVVFTDKLAPNHPVHDILNSYWVLSSK